MGSYKMVISGGWREQIKMQSPENSILSDDTTSAYELYRVHNFQPISTTAKMILFNVIYTQTIIIKLLTNCLQPVNMRFVMSTLYKYLSNSDR